MAGIWSEIPKDLVSMVVERLVCVDDLIRFRAVCKPWRSFSILEEQKKKKSYSPLMMLAMADNDNMPSDDNDGQGVRSFVIPYDGDGHGGANTNKTRRIFEIESPKAQGRRCWGSPYGLLVTVGLDLNIGLLNPFTGAELPLPPQPILQDQSLIRKQLSIEPLEPDHIIAVFTCKFSLGWHRSSQRLLVMAIFGAAREVAFTFTAIGNQPPSSFSWTCIESTLGSVDAILFKGRIFIISYDGNLSVWDIKEETPPKAIHIAPPPEDLDITNTCFYLVQMGGYLHLVLRDFDSIGGEGPFSEHHYLTTDFTVWRFNFSNSKWFELDDLGEYALFLGNNTSFAISTTTYPDFSRNSVYFTDDRFHQNKTRFCHMGVYDYEERTIEPFDIANMGEFSKFSRPIFFMPTL